MKTDIDKETANRARLPHNIFMLNLILVHLLMTPAAIALDIGELGMIVPLIISLLIMLFTYIKNKKMAANEHWFVHAHYILALNRYRMLLISYAVTAGFLAFGWLISKSSPDPHMQKILETVFIRIAIMPVLLMVMIEAFLESSAIGMVSKGEIPDSVIKQLPANVKVPLISQQY